jgi:hypothetical protein
MKHFHIASIVLIVLFSHVFVAQVTAPFPSTQYPIKPHKWPYPIGKYPPVEVNPVLSGSLRCPVGSGEYNGYTRGADGMSVEADPNTFWVSTPDYATGIREINDVSQLRLTSPCVRYGHVKSMFVIGKVSPKALVGKSPYQVIARQPMFFIESQSTLVVGTTFGITRLQTSGDSREFPKALTSVGMKAWHPQWCYQGSLSKKPCGPDLLSLQPEQPLESGEYIIWETDGVRKSGASEIWEFAIR